MANTTLTADIIATAALPILDNQLGWINKLYRAPEEEFSKSVNGYKVGDTISIRRPADFTVRTGATLSTQDVIEGKVSFTVNQQIGIDFEFSSLDLTLKIEDLSERVIKPAMIRLKNHMAADLATVAYQGLYNWAGTAGQTINSYADFAKGPERLDEMAVPMEDRLALLSPADHWALLGSQTTLYNGGLVSDAYRDGSLGRIGGVDTYMTQVVPTHTVGALGGTPAVNGGTQNVTYDTAKNTWTQTLNTDGWSNSITNVVRAGDVFTIANVFMVNPKTKASTGILQQFVVTADANSGASTGPAALTISPPIITSGPYQTVNAAPADNALLTMVGTAATGYKQNLVMHKNAMALAVVPMELPQAAYGAARKSEKGMSVRVIPIYDGTNDISKWRLDLLYGRRLIDPRLGTRLSGTA
jgi:hypothetical protein